MDEETNCGCAYMTECLLHKEKKEVTDTFNTDGSQMYFAM